MDRIQSIVVPTDFSPFSEAAAVRAVTLARLDGASIYLVHAPSFPLITAPYGVSVPAAVSEGIRRAAQEKLEEARKAIEGKGVQKVTTEIADASDAVQAIDDAAKAHGADLVVMGTHGHSGFKHAFLGSVAERTLRTVDCPVLAVKEDPAKAEESITRILLAVDFSVHSDRAVEVAVGLSKRLAASVDVIHAFGLPRDYLPYASPFGVELEQKIQACASERLESVSERFEESSVPVALHFRRGCPSVVIAEAAEEIGCQLIIMGTRGNSGLSHVLLGSIAERTLRTAHCSVLAVKAEERQGNKSSHGEKASFRPPSPLRTAPVPDA
jgi:nucleotide-binding universal stress UspA family protein